MRHLNKKSIVIVVVIVIVFIAIIGGIFGYQYLTSTKWKTFRSTEYGFELQYPGSWIIEEKRDGSRVLEDGVSYNLFISHSTDKEYGIFDLKIIKNDRSKDYFGAKLEEIEKSKNKSKETNIVTYNYDETLIDGIKSIRKTSDVSGDKTRAISIQNILTTKNAVISIMSLDSDGDRMKDTTEYMLSTFKFTN